jgi:ABC-type multidrug transport system fused ATPase/permease subunit
MHFTPSSLNSWCNLPRAGGVAYAAQESWVLNDTIRSNILFGSEYDEERYKSVIFQCALERDLELFEAGDLTEVGEKGGRFPSYLWSKASTREAGLTLSGGQKARCTLARAIYSKAEILLLDDVLAALEYVQRRWIFSRLLIPHAASILPSGSSRNASAAISSEAGLLSWSYVIVHLQM